LDEQFRGSGVALGLRESSVVGDANESAKRREKGMNKIHGFLAFAMVLDNYFRTVKK
jgi:hypothetical protein